MALTPTSSTTPIEEPVHTVFVHLCSGDVEIVAPATAVSVEAQFVTIFNGEAVVATYARRDVYLCSKVLTSPTLS